MVYENGDVARTFSQGRKGHRYNLEAEKEILPEAACPNLFMKISVGGSDYAHVNLYRPVPPDPIDLPLLKGA
jgi:hypothetical protein